MSSVEIIFIITGVLGLLPAVRKIFRELWGARRLDRHATNITVKLEDGTSCAAALIRPVTSSSCFEALPTAREVSVH